jgi:serine O-acetyltransferase
MEGHSGEHAMSSQAQVKDHGEISLLAQVREDLQRHRGEWTRPGFQAVAVHRLGARALRMPGIKGKFARKLHKLLFVLVRNFYGIELPATTKIGRRLLLGHQHGIVVHERATIGDDCVIRHNVTLGNGAKYWTDEAPHLGDRVRISPGVVVIGDVHIGDDVQIGPNALVTTDVPAGAMVFEKPTRVLRLAKQADGATPVAATGAGN